MPRVGSSSNSTLGSIKSQRARMHFCWLPPERLVTGTSPPAVLIASSLMDQSTARFSARGSTSGPKVSSGRRRSVMFSATVMRSNRPRVLRSSVTMAMPALIASSGCVNRTGRPSSRIVPAGGDGLAPKIASSSSVRPGTQQPGDAHDLAGPHRERDVAQAGPAAARRARRATGPRPRGPPPAAIGCGT